LHSHDGGGESDGVDAALEEIGEELLGTEMDERSEHRGQKSFGRIDRLICSRRENKYLHIKVHRIWFKSLHDTVKAPNKMRITHLVFSGISLDQLWLFSAKNGGLEVEQYSSNRMIISRLALG